MTTVAELIEQLSKLDQSSEIIVNGLEELFLITIEDGDNPPTYWLDNDLMEDDVEGFKLLHQF